MNNDFKILMVDDDVAYAKMIKRTLMSGEELEPYWNRIKRSFDVEEFELKIVKRNNLEDFKKREINFLHVEEPEKSLDIFDDYKPNAVLIDYHMPQMNGMSLFREIQKKKDQLSGEQPKLIMLSSNEDGDLVLDMAKNGIQYYVEKGDNEIESILSIIATGYFFEA